MSNNGKLKKYLKLYLVTDSEILKNRDFYKSIEDAIKGGVKIIQLREKNASGKEFLEKAIKLRELTKKYDALLIINDRIDIAILSNADGVHVGQSDIDANLVRKLLGEDKIIGVSAKTIDQAQKAKLNGADYIGVGAMYNTSTKLDAKCIKFDTVKEIRKNVDIPIVLIGGISIDKIKELKELDSDGYAIISAILKKDNIYLETKRFISII